MTNYHPNASCPWCHTTEFLRLIHMVEELEVTVRVTCDFCSCIGPKRFNAREAWVAWDAMERGEWYSKPTEVGWWWMKDANGKVYIEKLTDRIDVIACTDTQYKWQGPIEPKE